ncbi:hypothetical protein [Lacimicrobium alkaliphilum]|uniref:Dockerin domain-containing protein n=1 Tax=Lacimicrobium alkaliphilum TaxID=1526571 RepID=A0ABQ1RC27_9ALTE|nr:hypothetical protein [Lacimicrobium alkaliphilum]GGD63073.1 hypothetical protein GCM10011357_17940 [Lacimicrobium alkaliphilum]
MKRLMTKMLTGTVSTLFMAGMVSAATTTYTNDADFDLGTLNSLNHDAPNNNQLQLNMIGDTFPVLWVANAGEDTMSRVNTDGDGCEEARYLTAFGDPNSLANHGAFSGPAPSRTAVDTEGNVYVANRNFSGNRAPELIKIAVEGGVDRNSNGVIDTSQDLNNDCMITPDEMLPVIDDNNDGIIQIEEFRDERVVWISPFAGPAHLGRSLCLDTNGNLWAGTYSGDRAYYKFDQNGNLLAGPIATNVSNYGCAVDSDGTLWGATLGSTLVELDTNTNTWVQNRTGQSNYGIGLGNDRVYLGSSLHAFNPATNSFQLSIAGGGTGVAVDGDGAVWFGTPTLRKFVTDGAGDLNTTPACSVNTLGGRGPIVGQGGRIWTINLNSNSVSQYDSNCNFISTVPVGRSPYTYSDATGFGARNQTDPTGIWTVISDGGSAGTPWDLISWNNEPEAFIPAGGSITVEARSADNQGDLGLMAYIPVSNNTAGIGLTGRFIQIRTTLRPDAAGISPILSDLQVSTEGDVVEPSCDNNSDGEVNLTDIGNINSNRNVAVPPGDPIFDLNSDGIINVLDARICILQCDNARCAISG